MEMITAIKQIIEKRKEDKLYPYTADVNEVQRVAGLSKEEFKRQGKSLRNQNKIKLIKTINGFTIDLI